MATLGQLAAGLAHELNNAVGVLQRNTEWLVQAFENLISDKQQLDVFTTTLQEGLPFSTSKLRERRKALEQRLDLSEKFAKQLAKTNLSEDQITKLIKENSASLERISLLSETGFVLHDMRLAAEHSTHVVQSVRELGFSNSGKMVLTSIPETINKALALVKSLLQNIRVEVSHTSPANIVANAGDLVQMWLNLIKNACESMKTNNVANPTLSIEITEDETYYNINVGDNGPGIPNEAMSKVFEPNFTTKIKGLNFGLGLGLSIVKKIVTDYKGNISVTSTALETHFIVQLPKPITSDVV